MPSRRNTLIRTITSFTGDIALGLAMASACTWIIQSAALGIFMSFMLWLLVVILSLALSQYLIHPASQLLLSDHKLDEGIDVALGMVAVLANLTNKAREGLWFTLQQSAGSFGFGRSSA